MSRALLAVLIASATVVIGLPALLPPAGMSVTAAGSRAVIAPVVSAGGLRPLFADVPPGGYPHETYAAGNCTWWAAYNRPLPPHLGDAWRWLDSAAATGLTTSTTPSPGAIAVYRAGPGYDLVHGHVAIVIAVAAGSFRVSEMNYLGLGVVDERDSPWPDWHVEGFIPR